MIAPTPAVPAEHSAGTAGSAGVREPVDLAALLTARPRPHLELATASGWRIGDGGAGRRIALVDAGVDIRHPDLAGARIEVPHTLDGPDPFGHATACASLLVGQGRRDVAGLVPEATLLVAPAFGRGVADVAARASAGIRWATAREADTIVLPFGSLAGDRRIAVAIDVARGAGIRVIAAAGNLGPGELTFPARCETVVSVTAHHDTGLVEWCSARADLAAAGWQIPAAGSFARTHLDGTSAAAVLAAALPG